MEVKGGERQGIKRKNLKRKQRTAMDTEMEASVCGPNQNLEEKTDCQRLLAGLHFSLKESKNKSVYLHSLVR